jgi:hypothetical protein
LHLLKMLTMCPMVKMVLLWSLLCEYRDFIKSFQDNKRQWIWRDAYSKEESENYSQVQINKTEFTSWYCKASLVACNFVKLHNVTESFSTWSRWPMLGIFWQKKKTRICHICKFILCSTALVWNFVVIAKSSWFLWQICHFFYCWLLLCTYTRSLMLYYWFNGVKQSFLVSVLENLHFRYKNLVPHTNIKTPVSL